MNLELVSDVELMELVTLSFCHLGTDVERPKQPHHRDNAGANALAPVHTMCSLDGHETEFLRHDFDFSIFTNYHFEMLRKTARPAILETI